MIGIRPRVRSRHALLHMALVLLTFAVFSACKSATDSGCNYNEQTNECT
ncbi:MAG: hypothetical protein R2910_05620 [Gemmatimonadales bacterium]